MPDSTGQRPESGPGMKDLRVLVTAQEAFPAMERAFLDARHEIWAGYRVFDLETKLRSDAARAVGETWFDLLVHVLSRGVAVRMVLSDFDPILAPDLHCASWQARRAFVAAREAAGPNARLRVVNALHSARVGFIPRLALWPRLVVAVARQARQLNGQTAAQRAKLLECSPGLRPFLKEAAGGTLSARKWPPPPLVPGTHHQKIAVFDRNLLCIGGLDLDERRYDDKRHRRRRDETWHDVQLMCRGAVAEEAQQHLETFLPAVAGQRPPSRSGRLLRTLSRRRRVQFPFLGPKPLTSELARAHHRMIGQARHLVYLETQFFRDRALARTLAEAAARQPGLGLILILPAAPQEVAFDGSTSPDSRFGEYLQAKCIGIVQQAFRGRLAICSPVRPERSPGTGRDTLCGSPIIYVHAKVSVFDESRAVVSSANLNRRSHYWDTEAGIALEDASDVEDLRRRVMAHWLPKDPDDAFFDPQGAASRWHKLACENGRRAPERRQGFLVPHDPKPAAELGKPLPLVPDAMV